MAYGSGAADTQDRILQATLTVLSSRGFRDLTTIEIAKVAGVSQGALFRYFPSKHDLVVAAARVIFARAIGYFQVLIESRESGGELVRKLWHWFQTPDFHAVFHLYSESLSDPDLRKALEPIVREHKQNISNLLEAAFPGAAGRVTRDLSFAMIFLMQGMAVQRHLYGDLPAESFIIESIQSLASWLLPDKSGRIDAEYKKGEMIWKLFSN